ncbi:MAG TPA: sensor histidine kinase [Chitinophagaceae bacterium]|nr:sensor histidine kinase [Chitinophagaceae bacterium]
MIRGKSQVVVHIVAWLIFMMLPFITTPGPEGTNKILTVIQTKDYWISFAVYIFVFYFNSYLLIPQFYLKKRYILYTITVLAVLGLGYFIKHSIDFNIARMNRMKEIRGFQQRNYAGAERPAGEQLRFFDDSMRRPPDSSAGFEPGMYHDQPPPGEPPHYFGDSLEHSKDSTPGFQRGPAGEGRQGFRGQPPLRRQVDLFAIFLLCTIWALSTATRIIQQMRETEERAVKAEADKANAELSFLKAQINPHFLFNTLNNIYSLAVRQSENTADCIMKLSNIMRYVTDEVNRDFVSLESEVECITNYIDLQRLRLNKKVQVDFSVNGNTEGKRIPPLVLMTFVENVFKYGISSHEASLITIKVFAEEKTISFFCRNRLFATERKAERTGIGIINTRQRLEHLYPKRHLLNITTGDGFYTVELTLQA